VNPVILPDHGIALGVEGDEIERWVVIDNILQELAQEGLCLGVGKGAPGVRAANARPGLKLVRATSPPLRQTRTDHHHLFPCQGRKYGVGRPWLRRPILLECPQYSDRFRADIQAIEAR